MEGILILAAMIITTLCLLGWEHNFVEKHGRSAIHWQYVVLIVIAILGMGTNNEWLFAIVAIGAIITIVYHTPKYGVVSAICIAIYSLMIIAMVISVLRVQSLAKKGEKGIAFSREIWYPRFTKTGGCRRRRLCRQHSTKLSEALYIKCGIILTMCYCCL